MPLRLISTDFDGTLVPAWDAPQRFCDELVELLQEIRQRGILWAVNTGRSPDLLDEAWAGVGVDFHPDYALTSERDVFRPCTEKVGNWVDFGDWNARSFRAHRELFDTALPHLRQAVAHIKARTGARILYNFDHVNDPSEPAGLTTRNEADMDWVVAYLDEIRAAVPKLHYQRNSIYLRFCHEDYDKGTALSELARLLGLQPGEIFAIGDHHNDLPMLNGRHAAHVACPANAIREVKDTVRGAGGYLAHKEDGYGLVEALRRIL